MKSFIHSFRIPKFVLIYHMNFDYSLQMKEKNKNKQTNKQTNKPTVINNFYFVLDYLASWLKVSEYP